MGSQWSRASTGNREGKMAFYLCCRLLVWGLNGMPCSMDSRERSRRLHDHHRGHFHNLGQFRGHSAVPAIATRRLQKHYLWYDDRYQLRTACHVLVGPRCRGDGRQSPSWAAGMRAKTLVRQSSSCGPWFQGLRNSVACTTPKEATGTDEQGCGVQLGTPSLDSRSGPVRRNDVGPMSRLKNPRTGVVSDSGRRAVPSSYITF